MPGILFCLLGGPSWAGSLDLARQLFEEGDWNRSRSEALRVLAESPERDSASLLAAVSTLRLSPQDAVARAALYHLGREAGNPDLRATASYELARVRWADGDTLGAFDAYARAFQSAADRQLFLRSGCAMFLLRQDNASLGEDDPALLQQLATCRNLWRWELRAEVRVHPGGPPRSIASRPAEWMVALYRTQIRPAIGHRCSLQPSCSEYFLQAGRQHGWLGPALLGDRLVREPGVVAAAEHPVPSGELTLFKDPLHDHDAWLQQK